MTEAAAPWKNRIVDTGEMSPDDILANPRNWRAHPDHQRDALKGVLDDVGIVQFVIINRRTGFLVDGHLRVALAKQTRQPTIPVVFVDLSDDEEALILITLDPIAAQAETDKRMLAKLLPSVSSDDAAVQALIAKIAEEAGLYVDGQRKKGRGGNEFDATPAEGPTRTQLGDLWQLGPHRLLVGDSTQAANLARLLMGEQIDLVWTDPPYNVAYVGKTKDALTIQNDSMANREFYQFLRNFYEATLQHTNAGAAIYVCHADTETVNFRTALTDAGWLLKQNLIWVKNQFVMGRQDYHWRHEPILYGWKPGAAHYFLDDRTQDTVTEQEPIELSKLGKAELIELLQRILAQPTSAINCDRPTRSEDHPTMKPIELVERFIHNSSHDDDIVYDGFGGSGATLVAAHRQNRRCRTMELNPQYADVILRRFEAETGEEPLRLE